jgi:16S rRNA processing protein RimM
MTSSASSYIEMGVLGKPKGLKGEIRLRLHNPQSSYFQPDKPVWLGTDQKILWHVARCVPYQKHHLISFKEASRLEDVQNLVLQPVYVPREALDACEDEQYYHVDLIGCSVLHVQGHTLGKVKEVLVTGANDVLVVLGPDGKEIDVPFMAPWIHSVDLDQRQIVIEPIDIYSGPHGQEQESDAF